MELLKVYNGTVSMFSNENTLGEETRRFYISKPGIDINYLSATNEQLGKELCLIDYANDEDIYERQVRTESSQEYILFMKRYIQHLCRVTNSDVVAFDYAADRLYDDRNA